MENGSTGRLIITAISLLLSWLTYYLIKQKFNNPEFGLAWGGVAFVGFFALLFLFISVVSWFGVYAEGKFREIDADFVAIQSEGLAQTEKGDTIFYWHFTCQWKDEMSGKTIIAKSPMFEGQDVYYNREKILVRINPENPEGFHFVDISFLSSTNQKGIPIITENEVKASLLLHQHKVQVRQNSKLGRLLNGPLQFFERNKALLTLISTLTPVFLVLGAILLWWFRFRK